MLSFYLSLIDDESQFGTFEKIYATYRKQMMYLAKSYMKSDFDAEDVVHDVFVRVATRHMKFISDLKNPEDVRNYLLKATKNTALNKLKRKERCNIAIESVSDAAKHLGRNASTAKKQLVRGKKILLNKLRSGGKDNVNDEG